MVLNGDWPETNYLVCLCSLSISCASYSSFGISVHSFPYSHLLVCFHVSSPSTSFLLAYSSMLISSTPPKRAGLVNQRGRRGKLKILIHYLPWDSPMSSLHQTHISWTLSFVHWLVSSQASPDFVLVLGELRLCSLIKGWEEAKFYQYIDDTAVQFSLSPPLPRLVTACTH